MSSEPILVQRINVDGETYGMKSPDAYKAKSMMSTKHSLHEKRYLLPTKLDKVRQELASAPGSSFVQADGVLFAALKASTAMDTRR